MRFDLRLTAVVAMIVAAGCGPEKNDPGPFGSGRTVGIGGGEPGLLDRPIATRVDDYSISRVSAEVLPVGAVPYDDFTLPLVSPNGEMIATQTGLAPEWSALVANDGATVPFTTRIEIHDLRLGSAESIERRAVVGEAALLGRFANDAGFIIESPRDNGERWIGLASWDDGSVTWLAQDAGMICAFGSIGPDGRLAYSRRPIGATEFELVMQGPHGTWTLPARDESWVTPSWSGVGDGLFVVRLDDGAFDLVHFEAASADTMRRTAEFVRLASSGSTTATALQSMTAHVGLIGPAGGPLPNGPQAIGFYHPSGRRAALWQPGKPLAIFEVETLAATIDADDPNFAIVTAPRALRRSPINRPHHGAEVVVGTQIPRRTLNPERPWVMLEPREKNVAVTMLRMLPADQRPLERGLGRP